MTPEVAWGKQIVEERQTAGDLEEAAEAEERQTAEDLEEAAEAEERQTAEDLEEAAEAEELPLCCACLDHFETLS
jgi:hypothetical protein